MNNAIIPAILETTAERIKTKIHRVAGLVSTVQVDICDGVFVPAKTYGSSGNVKSIQCIKQLADEHSLALELDLMVDLDRSHSMDRWITTLLTVQPARVVFHVGSTYRWEELFMRLQTMTETGTIPFECGLAVRIKTTRKEIRKIYDEHPFSYIQVMGITAIGHSGHKLSPGVFDRIKKIRRLRKDIEIQVDGGVKPHHAAQLFAAGVQRLGMNSGLFSCPEIADCLDSITSPRQ